MLKLKRDNVPSCLKGQCVIMPKGTTFMLKGNNVPSCLFNIIMFHQAKRDLHLAKRDNVPSG